MKSSIKALSAALFMGVLAVPTMAIAEEVVTTQPAQIAAGPISLTEGVGQIIGQRLQDANGSMMVKAIRATASPSFYEVELMNGDVLYSAPDGSHFVYGALYQVEVGKLTNITEQRDNTKRVSLMAQIADKELVIFPAKGDEKAQISVFTDIDCGYCRKLHNEVPRLNELGITVRYLAYPRAGVYDQQRQYTGSYKKIKSVWCDDKPMEAMTKAKQTGFIKENLDCDAPVEKQLLLGQQVGVRGTPAIVLQNGSLMPGYMPADALAQKMGIR